jgi:hypothetical protein
VQTAPRGQGGMPWRLRLTDMLGSALRHWQGGPEVEESEPAAQQGWAAGWLHGGAGRRAAWN